MEYLGLYSIWGTFRGKETVPVCSTKKYLLKNSWNKSWINHRLKIAISDELSEEDVVANIMVFLIKYHPLVL